MFGRFFIKSVFFISLSSGGILLFAQTQGADVNFNDVYRYPFSIGAELQFPSPATQFGTDYDGNFSLMDFSSQMRLPLPRLPVLQPFVRLGVATVRAPLNAAAASLEKFNHSRFYAAGGLGYMHKFSKSLEAGAELEFGMGYSLFPKIDLAGGRTHAAWNLQASLGGRATFNPSYNISINLHPALQYQKSLSPLTRFDGFAFSIGITTDYRLGTDPDNPEAEIRAIEFGMPRLDDIFAAMQSYYVGNPAGEITITNTEESAVRDVKVSFFQPDYMNIATTIAEIPEIQPGERVNVPITAVFDRSVFSLEGVVALTGEIQVDYMLRTRRSSQVVPVTYDLYDKNSITWDDDTKVAAFITSGDSALGNYVSYLRQISRDITNPGYSEAVQIGMQVFYGLTEIGCFYQRDPTLAFEDAQGNALMVDSVNLPRETLVKLSGDCDDLTVLYNAMLEAAGIATGFITAPGHIYSVFNTGIPARDYQLIHPGKNMTIAIDGELWVPVEITYIGEGSFEEAWRSGADEFQRYIGDDAMGLYFTRDSQRKYRPVGFNEQDLGLQYGDRTKIVRDFAGELKSSITRVTTAFERQALESDSKGAWNRMGIVAARLQDYSRAENAFFRALSLDRNYVSPKINLANVYFQLEEFRNALRLYHEAEQSLREDGLTETAVYSRLVLNISRAYHEVENYEQAERYSDELSRIDPNLANRYTYPSGSAGTRASSAAFAPDILYIKD